MNNNDNDGQRLNQISWQQFSNQIRGAENARAEYLEECRSNRRDEEDAKFVDVEVSTPRRSSSGGGGGGAIRRAVVKFQLAPVAAAAAAVAVPVEETTSHYEVVQKPKTRAARRAMEEAELEEEEVTTTTQPRRERERRSDYWVDRDDKRRGDARTFKMTAQLAVGGE